MYRKTLRRLQYYSKESDRYRKLEHLGLFGLATVLVGGTAFIAVRWMVLEELGASSNFAETWELMQDRFSGFFTGNDKPTLMIQPLQQLLPSDATARTQRKTEAVPCPFDFSGIQNAVRKLMAKNATFQAGAILLPVMDAEFALAANLPLNCGVSRLFTSEALRIWIDDHPDVLKSVIKRNVDVSVFQANPTLLACLLEPAPLATPLYKNTEVVLRTLYSAALREIKPEGLVSLKGKSIPFRFDLGDMWALAAQEAAIRSTFESISKKDSSTTIARIRKLLQTQLETAWGFFQHELENQHSGLYHQNRYELKMILGRESGRLKEKEVDDAVKKILIAAEVSGALKKVAQNKKFGSKTADELVRDEQFGEARALLWGSPAAGPHMPTGEGTQFQFITSKPLSTVFEIGATGKLIDQQTDSDAKTLARWGQRGGLSADLLLSISPLLTLSGSMSPRTDAVKTEGVKNEKWLLPVLAAGENTKVVTPRFSCANALLTFPEFIVNDKKLKLFAEKMLQADESEYSALLQGAITYLSQADCDPNCAWAIYSKPKKRFLFW